MDNIWHNFLQFDLYAGHKVGYQNSNFFIYLFMAWWVHYFRSIKIILNFGQFFQDIFSIRLIRGSTYTRVYTVVFNFITVFLAHCQVTIKNIFKSSTILKTPYLFSYFRTNWIGIPYLFSYFRTNRIWIRNTLVS